MKSEVIVLVRCLALLLAFFCSYSDIRSRRIPNIAVLVLVALAVAQSLSTGVWLSWQHGILAVIVGFALFAVRCFGAGDVKYFWACMLAVPDQIETLLIGTALAGLVLAIVYLARHRFRPKEVGTLPYGVAISTGLALCLCKAMF